MWIQFLCVQNAQDLMGIHAAVGSRQVARRGVGYYGWAEYLRNPEHGDTRISSASSVRQCKLTAALRGQWPAKEMGSLPETEPEEKSTEIHL
jgi:hypothetical protein